MKESTYNRIQRFLNREMSTEEVKDFDQDLEKNPDLMEGLASELAIRKAAKENRKADIKQRLKTQKEPSSKRISTRIIQIAAIFILLIGAFGLVQTIGNESEFLSEKDEKAMNEIVDGAMIDLNTAGADDDGRNAFREKKYLEAIPAFNDFLDKKVKAGAELCDYNEINFYLGAIYLYRTNEYEKAIEHLTCTEATLNNGKNYNNKIPYLLIVANLRAGQVKEAKVLMEKYRIQPSNLEPEDADFLE